MTMLLPPKTDGSRLTLPSDARQITIIGANGSGKTRFTDYIQQSLGQSAFRISALEAICDTAAENPAEASIDRLYANAVATSSFLHSHAATTFERLMILLLNEEMVKLVEGGVPRKSCASRGWGASILAQRRCDGLFADETLAWRKSRAVLFRSGSLRTPQRHNLC